MTVVLLLHPKISCMTIPPVVAVKKSRTIPPRYDYVTFIPLVLQLRLRIGPIQRMGAN